MKGGKDACQPRQGLRADKHYRDAALHRACLSVGVSLCGAEKQGLHTA
eukprot:COSAG06_NODE_26413_length_615_cov_1.288760_1_plen_47_part_01